MSKSVDVSWTYMESLILGVSPLEIKTVLSEGRVAIATLKEEKLFLAERRWSEDG